MMFEHRNVGIKNLKTFFDPSTVLRYPNSFFYSLFSFSSLGFNPRWSEKFNFVVNVPELCLLRFVVRDKDVLSQDDLIGQATIPLLSMMQGNAPASSLLF